MISKWTSRWHRSLRFGDDEAMSFVRIVIGLMLLGAMLIGLEHYRGDQLQDRRTGEQAQLLEGMESLRNPAVSEVVTDWRMAYPEPNDERLAELRDLAMQVQTDPSPLLGVAATADQSAEFAPRINAGSAAPR